MRAQLEALRSRMAEYGIDVYLITMDDDHQSEYVGAYYREIAEVSGFTGSAGKLVVTKDEAGLWTDGRYFVQAAKQLKDTGIELMKMGEPETPEIEDYIYDKIPADGCFGFNGKCIGYVEAKGICDKLEDKNIKIASSKDVVDEIWKDRPAPDYTKMFVLDEKYAGRKASEKLAELKNKMSDLKAEAHVITMLDDIAWLLNMRAADIPHNPVFLSFLLINGDDVCLYTDKEHLTPETEEYLSSINVRVNTNTEEIYTDVNRLDVKSILMEEDKTNYALVNAVPKSTRIINMMLPSTIAKAVKNQTEMENLRKAHLKDGAAVTKFMFWFKQNIGKLPMTEWSVLLKLHEFRSSMEGFLDESFSTISAYGSNAAMCHYSPSSENDTVIEPRGLYLVDSGGQYYEGTTDITRTWACGEITKEESTSLTLSVMGNLRLAAAKFLKGTNGVALDYIAREPFWTRGLNYNHGTGHGVGYLLNVHERPVGIRYRLVPERQDSYPMEEGLYVSDEPGLYIEGSHGVRTENMLLCVNDYSNEYGQFCKFETCTLCPIDKSALNVDIMEDRDIELLNAYHENVYNKLESFMNEEEKQWLMEVCSPLTR